MLGRFRRGVMLLPVMIVPVMLLPVIAAPLAAQYIPPGSTRHADELPYPEEEIRTGVDEAAWNLGGLRLSPWLGLSDLSLVRQRNELGEETSDLTATAGGGLRAYLRNGRKVVWAAHALPEYVYWQDESSRRRLNGRYGAGVFAHGNRLDLEASWRRSEQQSFYSSEVQQLTSRREDASRFVFDLVLAPRFSLAGGVRRTELRNLDDAEIFERLDRDEEEVFLRFFVRAAGWSFALGVDERATDFTQGARNLSHEGEAGVLYLGYEGGRFALRLEAQRLELTPRAGSLFAALETTTGHVETLWELTGDSSLFVYSRRRLDYSILGGVSNMLAERLGSRLSVGISALRLGLLVESGDDEYLDLRGATSRLDEVYLYGATLSFGIRGFAVSFHALRSEYDSSLDAFDRDVTTWGFSFQLGKVRDFALGRGDRLW